MSNIHLFQLINAPPGLSRVHLAIALVLARWLIYLLPLALITAWVRGNHAARRELLQTVFAVLLALGLAQIIGLFWPQPRPFVLHLGMQYLAHKADPGMPSDHVVVFWSLGLAVLRTRRYALWGFPLLALGLLVGWSRVYLGIHFPYDVLAALPVAWIASLTASMLQKDLLPLEGRVLYLYDRLLKRLRTRHSTPRRN